MGRGIDLHLSGRAADQQLVHVIRLTSGWCWATADFRRSYLHSIDVQITIATSQIQIAHIESNGTSDQCMSVYSYSEYS